MQAIRQTAAIAVITALILQITGVSAAEFAPVMPKAVESLLLDIDSLEQRVIAVGERGHIMVSSDYGENFQQARVPSRQMLTAVHIGTKQAWAVGHDGLILASGDGGGSWRIQRDGLAVQAQVNLEAREQAHTRVAHLLAAEPMPGADRAQYDLDLEEAQWDLEDAEETLTEPVFTSPLLDVWFVDDLEGWAVGAFGTALHTQNGGQQWQDISHGLDNPDEFHFNSIVGDSQGSLLIAGESGTLFRSLDSGNTWQRLSSPYVGSWFGALYDQQHQRFSIFGLRGSLYQSSDKGDNWQLLAPENHLSLAGGDTAEGVTVLVGSVGAVLYNADGSSQYQRIMLPDRLSLSAVKVMPDRILVVGQGGVKTLTRASFDE
jgi:photosystem II stability/assembly factor-like uncharacterized protein